MLAVMIMHITSVAVAAIIVTSNITIVNTSILLFILIILVSIRLPSFMYHKINTVNDYTNITIVAISTTANQTFT